MRNRLTKQETDDLVRHILDLDARGFPPWAAGIVETANALHAGENCAPFGMRWAKDFVNRRPELPVKFRERYEHDSSREVETKQRWFETVRTLKARYGVQDENMYNFDEYRGNVDQVGKGVLHAGSSIRRQIQHPNQEFQRGRWFTTLQAFNATGQAVPPFLIFPSFLRFSDGNHKSDVPRTWRVTASENGVATAETATAWLEHFDKHTKPRAARAYRILILDSHEFHNSIKFQHLCEGKRIVTLCVPHHYSHQLQPFNAGYFPLLQEAYKEAFEDPLGRNEGLTDESNFFLHVFFAVYNTVSTEQNIRASFQDAGLVPNSPDSVLSKRPLRSPVPTDPARAGGQLEPDNRNQRQPRTALAEQRNLQRRNHSYTRTNKSQMDRVWETFQEITEMFESCNEDSIILQAEMKEVTEGLRNLIRERAHRKGRQDPFAVLTTASRGRKIGKLRGKRHCRGCGRAGHDLRNCDG
jgi:hypothetical protein